MAEALAQARQTLDKLERQGSAGRLATPTDILTAFYRQREAVESGDGKAYVCTGYMALDSLLGGGLINSGLYLLAARPGMGKTTLALNIADRVAKADPVLFIWLAWLRTGAPRDARGRPLLPEELKYKAGTAA